MKRFARCACCRQWYIQAVTVTVDVCHRGTSRRQVVWCLRCVEETEQRSASLHNRVDAPLIASSSQDIFGPENMPEALPPDEYQRCMQEHLQMMERALHEEEAVLVPSIEVFLQRCQALQEQLDVPEHIQRLQGCWQYWETFLRVLKQ